MPQTLGAHLAYGASFLLLLGAVLLTFGGVTLIAYILRQGRDELKHRVAMVEPRGSSPSLTDLVPADVFHREPLLDIPGGLSIPARREIMRRLGALNVPANRAVFVFTVLRGAAVLLATLLGYFAGASMHALDNKPAIVLLIGIAFGIGGWFLPAMVVGRHGQEAHRKPWPPACPMRWNFWSSASRPASRSKTGSSASSRRCAIPIPRWPRSWR